MSTPDTTAPTPPTRITQGEIIRALLERGSAGGSSVSLSRNAKGETQIEVVVRTAHDGEAQTIGHAQALAEEVYDKLRAKYPMAGSNGDEGKPS